MAYTHTACILVTDLTKLQVINHHFAWNGYGNMNVSIPFINEGDPDSADPVAYGAESPVDPGIMALINVATFFDGFEYRKAPKGTSILDSFAAELGLRRKPLEVPA